MKCPKCGDLITLKINLEHDKILGINICKSCELNIQCEIKNIKNKKKIKLYTRIQL
jgi:transcription elongation factor Elf1